MNIFSILSIINFKTYFFCEGAPMGSAPGNRMMRPVMSSNPGLRHLLQQVSLFWISKIIT